MGQIDKVELQAALSAIDIKVSDEVTSPPSFLLRYYYRAHNLVIQEYEP